MFGEEREGGLINGKRIDSLDKMPATHIYLPVDTASPCYRLDKISASLSNLRHQSNARIRAVQLRFAVVEKGKATAENEFRDSALFAAAEIERTRETRPFENSCRPAFARPPSFGAGLRVHPEAFQTST